MSLAVIPAKEFKALLNGVSEELRSSRKFSYDEMQHDYSKTYKDVLYYMSTTNVKFIGSGSSRTAFYMPPGSVTEDRTCPSCFKVAKNKRGVWQNDAEVGVFNKYGKKRACFPELFDYDKQHKYYLLTEVGTPLSDDFDAKRYIDDWNNGVDKNALRSSYKISDYDSSGMIEDIAEIALSLAKHSVSSAGRLYQKETLEKLSKIAKAHKKYAGIFDFISFAVAGGTNDVEFGDFKYNRGNWAVVVRDGEEVVIPIDFGFTHEIAKRYQDDKNGDVSSSNLPRKSEQTSATHSSEYETTTATA